jgi:hypothetical protein
MDSMKALAMGEANRGKELMVFDWDKAAEMIKASGCKEANAGLGGDWEWTGGSILIDGKPDFDSYTYLASTWAIPELEIDGDLCSCYRMQHEVPEWDSQTKWPPSALKILEGK